MTERAISFNLHAAQSKAFVTPATEVLYGGAAGGGKALCADTPIPTPRGWKRIGDIVEGDQVLDEKGRPTTVIQAFEHYTAPGAYELTFDDGATIIADAPHKWITFNAAELAALTRKNPEWRARRRAKRPSRATGNRSALFNAVITTRNKNRSAPSYEQTGQIRTTAEIVATLKTKTGRTNHAIPVASIEGEPKSLPIPPFTFGLWLGDGTRGQGAITQAAADMEALKAAIEADGYKVRKRPSSPFAWGVLGLQKQLRIAGLINARRIPQAYLRASRDQRISLLRGLMDADGHAKESGACEFVTTHRDLADSFGELLTSLGIKAQPKEGRAKLRGRDIGLRWRFTFTPSFIAFTLPRKARQQKPSTRRTTRFRYIVAAKAIPPRYVRCIAVDSPSHLFLAGRAMVPTHNSHLLRIAAIAWCQMIPGLQVALFRRIFPDLNANHMEGPSSFPALLAPLTAAGKAKIVKGEITFPNGSRIALCHCQYEKDKFSYQGAEFHVLMIDELTHFTESIYTYLRARVRMTGLRLPEHLRPLFPRILCSANPGGVGHVWVKRTFVNQGTAPHQMPASEGGMVRQYMPARLADNPSLLRDDPLYAQRLAGLGDPLLVRAMLDGDWSIVAGAMFGEVWRHARHTVEPFAIPADWPIWWGMDDGFTAPASIHFLTRDPKTKTIFVIGEIYRPNMLPQEIAQRIERMSRNFLLWHGPDDLRPHGELAPGILDGAAFAETGQSTERGQKVISRGAQLRQLGLKITPAEKWPGSRVHRVRELHRLLAPNPNDPRGLPGIRFFTTCKRAIETIPSLPRDSNNPEDVDTDAEDHAYDSVTYGLQRFAKEFKARKMA